MSAVSNLEEILEKYHLQYSITKYPISSLIQHIEELLGILDVLSSECGNVSWAGEV